LAFSIIPILEQKLNITFGVRSSLHNSPPPKKTKGLIRSSDT